MNRLQQLAHGGEEAVGEPFALQELIDYWRRDYDWRKAEAAINAYEHYRVEVEGVPIHFIRKAGFGPKPTPLILTHGWPWTFWHWSQGRRPAGRSGGGRWRPGRGVRRDRSLGVRLRVLRSLPDNQT